MAEATKFTEEEMKEIKGIQDEYFNTQNEFGQLYMARLRWNTQGKQLDSSEQELKEKLNTLEGKEKEFLDKITAKYGEGSLNQNTGEFIPNKS